MLVQYAQPAQLTTLVLTHLCVLCQDLIEENASVVVDLLFSQGGHLYICGDGQSMAKDVHEAVRRIAASELGVSEEQAEAKLAELAQSGRYCREIWN